RQDRHLRDCRRTTRCGERIAPSKWKPLKELSLVGTVPSCFTARGCQIRQRTKRCCCFTVATSILVVGKKRSIHWILTTSRSSRGTRAVTGVPREIAARQRVFTT